VTRVRRLKEIARSPLAVHEGQSQAKITEHPLDCPEAIGHSGACVALAGRRTQMNIPTRLRDWPLRTQLMLVFAFLSITTTAISTITVTTLSGQRTQTALRDRSLRIARRLQQQLQPVVAFNDQLAARELFAAYAGDRELDGVAVYDHNGELIEGLGNRPQRLGSSADLGTNKGHVVVVDEVKTPYGRSGRLYLSFSTRLNDEVQRHDIWIATGSGASVILCALILAVQMARRIARRLVQIADAANRVASGEWSHAVPGDHAKDEIGKLAHSFNVMVAELKRLSIAHEQLVSTERERLESLVAERTKALEQSREMFKLMAESTRAVPFTLDLTRGCFPYIGAQGVVDSGVLESEWKKPGGLDTVVPRDSNPEVRRRFDECESGSFEFVTTLSQSNQRRSEVRWTGTCEWVAGAKVLRGLMLDITEVRRLGRELAAAQKLEAVGRLAAGVAHEINTPVQFVTDNVQFVRTSLTDIAAVIQAYRGLQHTVQSAGDITAAVRRAGEAETAADLDYVMENAPLAIESSLEGLGRIATIVRSMKEFAHPDQAEKKFADLNQAIRSTLVIAHNEYKYVAELDAQFGELPPVQCYLGEVNQVVLNLLVNAAHAISDVVRDTGVLGKLTVRTRLDGDEVEVSIGDTGTGIPEAVRDKIFDPFFTTKEVGVGTGQGLAIARSVIVKKHGGTLRFETECGKGTTFFIRLPIDAAINAVDAGKLAA
jgi:signal transduction histidine kinase/HAMP domain-containing protein